MSHLSINFGGCFFDDEGDVEGDFWGVLSNVDDEWLLHGFARKQDAEIARRVLDELGFGAIDDADELNMHWDRLGRRGPIMKQACERMQW